MKLGIVKEGNAFIFSLSHPQHNRLEEEQTMLSMTSIVEFIFSIALFVNAILFIPQIIHLIRHKTAAGLSLLTFLGFLLIQLAIVLHGLIVRDYLLTFGYLLSMLTCGTVVFLIVFYKKGE
jgi:MtN3 and saliva related transmembrane protein